MRRRLVLTVAAMAPMSGLVAAPAPSARSALTSIGRLGEVLHVDDTSIVADFTGVTPIADAYKPRPTGASDESRTALQNAPAGSTVSGGVCWDVYRDLVTNVVLLDKVTGTHLAQWNLN